MKGKKNLYRDFFTKTLNQNPDTASIMPDKDTVVCFGNQIYQVPDKAPSLQGLKVLRWGWLLGTNHSDRFLPSHALASGLRVKDFQMVIEFPLDDPNLNSYLRGSPLKKIHLTKGKTWVLVAIEGLPLGWGWINQGQIKSHFPSWLRRWQ